MNFKKILIALLAVGLGLLSSCKGGYSCPTYSQNTDENLSVMVKNSSSSVEVRL